MNKQEMKLQLNEIKMRYTGKNQFSPYTELKELQVRYESKKTSEQLFKIAINEIKNDLLWRDYFYMLEVNNENKEIIISPWSDNAKKISPNKLHITEYKNALEIAMGSPTKGELWMESISQKTIIISKKSTASFIWSTDSNYLAYSEWTNSKMQIIRVLHLETMITKNIENEFRVVQFDTFIDGVIHGIDSPIYESREFNIQIQDIGF